MLCKTYICTSIHVMVPKNVTRRIIKCRCFSRYQSTRHNTGSYVAEMIKVKFGTPEWNQEPMERKLKQSILLENLKYY